MFIIQEAGKKRNKQDWIELGVAYLEMKKKDPSVTMTKFASLHEINFNTLKSAFRKFKTDILEASEEPKKNRDKAYWVKLGVKYRESNTTAKSFAEIHSLNYETFARAMRKFKDEITQAIQIKELQKKKPKSLTKAEKLVLLINGFRSGLRKITGLGKTKAEQRSQKWFETTIKSTVKTRAAKRMEIGRLYTYAYDAKHKETLPYWDMFPLIVYLGSKVAKNGNKLHLGLNLHYIPVKARKEFLEELLKLHASTELFTKKTRLKIDWTKVKGMRGADLMIHSYLPQQFKSAPLKIDNGDWASVVFLPTQRFVSNGKKHSAKSVWAKY